ncbi:ESX-1 secretion-associated protein [Nocardia puris]|uniref:type VII secretion target n=1 Tax=Nocardia puris TaxID=208602 RepID=UPI001895DC1D|nr:type VII secretion target [Nocardia puris]MBF6369536.1 ESX-1 secretion-associated protein [Nocardia puris]MBF6458977.1 ESX-1 secretion-associated protein [Nocardia puris]
MVEGPQAGQLQVNPEALKTFANTLSTGAGTIRGLNAGNGFGPAAGALPGTEFGASVTPATDAVNTALTRISTRLDKAADTTRNAAGAYEVAEGDFATRLQTIALELP